MSNPAIDIVSRRQIPSHAAEFVVPTLQYSSIRGELDRLALRFQLKSFNPAPGLDALFQRKVFFAAYGRGGLKMDKSALLVTNARVSGKMLLWVFDDYFSDVDTRAKFITEVNTIVENHGGKLAPYQLPTRKTNS